MTEPTPNNIIDDLADMSLEEMMEAILGGAPQQPELETIEEKAEFALGFVEAFADVFEKLLAGIGNDIEGVAAEIEANGVPVAPLFPRAAGARLFRTFIPVLAAMEEGNEVARLITAGEIENF